jgi:hypothetical protein
MWFRGLGLCTVLAACGSHDVRPGDAANAADAVPDATVTASTVGSAGGIVTTPDGVVLDIPAGALATDTTIRIVRVTDNAPTDVVGPVFDLQPDGTQFAKPVRLTLRYDPLAPNATAPNLALATRVGSEWSGQGFALVDTGSHQVSGYITHFSLWAIVPSPNNCLPNLGCLLSCAGARLPEYCCSIGRGTCWAVLHQPWPDFVACYANCVGTRMTSNFANSKCLSGCCASHNGTTNTGTCMVSNDSDALSVLACGQACIASGQADESSICRSANLSLRACAWNATASPGIGGQCGAGSGGSGVSSQHLLTTALDVLDQIWGNPAVLEVTGGSLNASSLTTSMTCQSNALGTVTGSANAAWDGAQYSGTWNFGTESGAITISPAW